MKRILVAAAGVIALSGYLEGIALDPSNRWLIRDYFNSVYTESSSARIGWNGNYSAGQAGSVSAEWQAATLSRVNYFRNMAGVPADITFDPASDAAAQQAALMMSAAGRISHTPDPSWPWYTVEAADAAYKSNLALGTSGPDAVTGYISDFGPSNANVGHRRWLLYPQTTRMGNGDVPGDIEQDLHPANVLRVIPDSFGDRPPTRDDFVAWPPRGHVPAPLVFARWSFSHPYADFSTASVSMESDGQPIPVGLEPVDSRFIGEPTLVWVPNGMDTNSKIHWPVPQSDEVIEVTISNVLIGGSPREFSYTVIIFDPDLPDETEVPTAVTATGPVIPTVPASFSVSSRDWAEGLQARIIHAVPHDGIYGGESGLSDFETDIANGYTGIQNSRVASGSAAFQLATPDHTMSQTLQIRDEFIIWPGPAQLTFASSLAWATDIQAASVQINTGSGQAWQTIWTTRGPVDENNTFTDVAIDLSDWEGKTARFRFLYEVDGLGSYWANIDGNSGWALDEITLAGISRITGIDELSPEMASDSVMITLEDTEVVYLQARDLAFGGRPLDWGPISEVTPSWHERIQYADGEWIEDPVLGWNFGSNSDWTYFLGLGWSYVEAFPWIYTSEGWSYYLRGSMESGLWLYNSDIGHLYTRSAFGNWFQHEPFDETSWKQFSG
jgi:hypothetical protein